MTLAASQAATGRNFLETAKSYISGLVFLDKNANGRYDTGEGLAGWTVYLQTSTGGAIASTTTDKYGNWHFNDLAAGAYLVKVATVAGHTLGSPMTGVFKITVGAGVALKGYNFVEKS